MDRPPPWAAPSWRLGLLSLPTGIVLLGGCGGSSGGNGAGDAQADVADLGATPD